MSDPLAEWYVHEIVLERFTGRGTGAYPSDDEYADPVVVACFISDGIKVTANAEGEQIVSTARAALPKGTAYVPVDSRATLPPEFGNRVTTVVWCAVANGGGQPTPDHVQIGLK